MQSSGACRAKARVAWEVLVVLDSPGIQIHAHTKVHVLYAVGLFLGLLGHTLAIKSPFGAWPTGYRDRSEAPITRAT